MNKQHNLEGRFKDRKNKKPKTNQCKECGEKTHNPIYCSVKCATKNSVIVKETKSYYCKSCNIFLRQGYGTGSEYCENCCRNPHVNSKYIDWNLITVDEFKKRAKNNHQYNSKIRALARSSIDKKQCAICGYNKHINVCHIRPVSDFKGNDTIADINAASNLVCLCPNHHWEIDHGIIDISHIKEQK